MYTVKENDLSDVPRRVDVRWTVEFDWAKDPKNGASLITESNRFEGTCSSDLLIALANRSDLFWNGKKYSFKEVKVHWFNPPSNLSMEFLLISYYYES